MKIGVVIAMEKEFLRVRDLITDYSTITINNKPFTTGKLGNNTIVMATSGIGKVNAAMCSLEMINAFHPDVMVSTGVAGGADVSLEVQQVVVAEQTCYHDVYCGSEVEYGQVIGQPSRFECAEQLVSKALALKCGTTVRKGLWTTARRCAPSSHTSPMPWLWIWSRPPLLMSVTQKVYHSYPSA